MEKKLTCVFIPARGGSKGIKNKNIIKINNKPLLYHTVKEASESNLIDKIFISTNSNKIKNIISKFGFNKVEIINRSRKSSLDTSPSELAIREFLLNYDYKVIFFIQATNIFLKKRDIDMALKKFFKYKYDSMLSVVKNKNFFWKLRNNKIISFNYDYKKRPRRQNFEQYYIENGSFYIFTKKGFIKSNNRLHGKIGYFPMIKESIFEIDNEEDLKIVKKITA